MLYNPSYLLRILINLLDKVGLLQKVNTVEMPHELQQTLRNQPNSR
jgi:hypothetical protein